MNMSESVWAPPAHWDIIDPANENKTLVLLDSIKHSAELSAIQSHWKMGAGPHIVSVHRIQNISLQQRYDQAKMKLQRDHIPPENMDIIAYHGTSFNDPALIYNSPTGFDISKGTARAGSVRSIHMIIGYERY